MTTTPEQIAAGLSEAQRDCLLFYPKGHFQSGTAKSLWRLDLVHNATITPFGLAVHAIIKDQTNDQ